VSVLLLSYTVYFKRKGDYMPKVGKRHFSYTKKGKAAAKAHAKRTGKKITKKSPKKKGY
jgi:hypothetical protein